MSLRAQPSPLFTPGHEEVLLRILSLVDYRTLLAASAVNTHWNEVVTNDPYTQLILRAAYTGLGGIARPRLREPVYSNVDTDGNDLGGIKRPASKPTLGLNARLARAIDVQDRWERMLPKSMIGVVIDKCPFRASAAGQGLFVIAQGVAPHGGEEGDENDGNEHLGGSPGQQDENPGQQDETPGQQDDVGSESSGVDPDEDEFRSDAGSLSDSGGDVESGVEGGDSDSDEDIGRQYSQWYYSGLRHDPTVLHNWMVMDGYHLRNGGPEPDIDVLGMWLFSPEDIWFVDIASSAAENVVAVVQPEMLPWDASSPHDKLNLRIRVHLFRLLPPIVTPLAMAQDDEEETMEEVDVDEEISGATTSTGEDEVNQSNDVEGKGADDQVDEAEPQDNEDDDRPKHALCAAVPAADAASDGVLEYTFPWSRPIDPSTHVDHHPVNATIELRGSYVLVNLPDYSMTTTVVWNWKTGARTVLPHACGVPKYHLAEDSIVSEVHTKRFDESLGNLACKITLVTLPLPDGAPVRDTARAKRAHELWAKLSKQLWLPDDTAETLPALDVLPVATLNTRTARQYPSGHDWVICEPETSWAPNIGTGSHILEYQQCHTLRPWCDFAVIFSAQDGGQLQLQDLEFASHQCIHGSVAGRRSVILKEAYDERHERWYTGSDEEDPDVVVQDDGLLNVKTLTHTILAAHGRPPHSWPFGQRRPPHPNQTESPLKPENEVSKSMTLTLSFWGTSKMTEGWDCSHPADDYLFMLLFGAEEGDFDQYVNSDRFVPPPPIPIKRLQRYGSAAEFEFPSLGRLEFVQADEEILWIVTGGYLVCLAF